MELLNNNAQTLVKFFEFVAFIRKFFSEQNFLDVMALPMVFHPGIEPHIHPLQIYSAYEKKQLPFYLQTSPEFMLKDLLSQVNRPLFSLTYSFRDEPCSPHHRKQFLMLEWYRPSSGLADIMEDCANLIHKALSHLHQQGLTTTLPSQNISIVKKTVQEIFQEQLGFDILSYLDFNSLLTYIKNHLKDIPLPAKPESLLWEDLFFLIFLNKIEPILKEYPLFILYEYPSPLAALSRIKENDSRVCERFEIYIHGVEIGNCFYELTDVYEQETRGK